MEHNKHYTYSPHKVAELLDETNWANEFTWQEILSLGNAFHGFRAKKGSVIFEEGDRSDSLCIIVSGHVNIIKRSVKGKQKLLATLRPSQTFGEQSLVDGEPRSADAVARDDVVYLRADRIDIFNLAETDAKLAMKLLSKVAFIISKRLRRASGQLIDLK